MSNNSTSANLVGTRGNRAMATILSILEREIYDQYDIPTSTQRRVRQLVIDQVNGYKDLVIDIVKSDSAILNEHWVNKLDQIHSSIQDLKRG